jgi:hypothetical protein
MPSPNTLESLLRSADAPALLTHLKLAQSLVSLPRRVFSAWGIPHDALPQCSLHAAARPGLRAIAVTGACSPTERRRVALAHHHICDEPTLWLFATPSSCIALMVDDAPDGSPILRTLDAPRLQPTSAEIAAWQALSFDSLCAPDLTDPAQAARRHLRAALDQDLLMRSFAAGFNKHFNLLRDAMLHGPDDPDQRAAIALQLLLRLLVLSMLQARGALDRDRSFLLRALRSARAQGRDLYLTALRPLCFGAINTPAHLRAPDATALGLLPFLNGGLFEPLPEERAHPDLTWPSHCWDATIEAFLARFPFATSGPDVHARAIDPEMLGKVFEGLMAPDQRHRSGTFYTPRHVVRSMVEQSLSDLLAERSGLPIDACAALVRGDAVPLSPDQHHTLSNALSRLSILDPAVGTGAFILEALAALRRCWRALGDPQRADSWSGVRALIHDHLWGIDVEPIAARLCELRLWLALLETWPADIQHIDALEPLPNLTHRVIVGDALLSPMEAARAHASASLRAAIAPVSHRHAASIASAEAAYLDAHGPQKLAARAALHDAERAASCALLDARSADLSAQLAPIAALHDSRDLFGQPLTSTATLRATHHALTRELASCDALRADLCTPNAPRGGVFWEARLAPVLSRGGFDLIVTNPPWVRAERVNPDSRAALNHLYRSASCDLWPDAAREGVTAHFGTQTDLAALFIERSLSWLLPGGQLAALVPAKLLRSLHGSPLRSLLSSHEVRSIEDASDAQQAMFDAVTYPAILHLRRKNSPEEKPRSSSITLWQGRSPRRWQAPLSSLFARGRSPAEPWLLAPPSALAAFHHMRQQGPALGAHAALRPRRGVMTGCNEAFLVEDGQLGRAQARWSRPVIGGRDLRSWSATPSKRIIWPMNRAQNPTPADKLPQHLRQHFDRFATPLRRRADWRPEHPLWRIYRAQDGICSPKVVWRDLGTLLDAAPVGPDVIPLNTVYYIPCDDMPRAAALAALLQCAPIRALARCLAERAQGGWRRHMAWVIASLPIPADLLQWLLREQPDPALDALAQRALDGSPQPLTHHIEALFHLSERHHAALEDLLAEEAA